MTASSVLCGHSLENDLKAMKIIHPFVIDTAVLYPHIYGLPKKMSLVKLVHEFLKVGLWWRFRGRGEGGLVQFF